MKTTNRRSTLLVAFALLALPFGPAPPAAAGPADAELCALGGVFASALAEGYELRDYVTDSLREGESRFYTLSLAGRVDYRVLACGDGAVHDLDLLLGDENGNLLRRDQARDALPIVDITPRWTGPFTVRVDMYDTVRSGRGYYTMVVLYR